MLLNQAIATQQSLYTEIQVQIDALQEQQREIQSYLQRLGSVESRMESAAQLLQQAIADIQEICPDELQEYKRTIDSLFTDSPIGFIEPADDDNNPDNNPDNDPTPTPPTPPTSDVEVIVDAVAVPVVEEVSTPTPAPVSSKKGGEIVATLPTVAQVPSLKKAELIQHLEALGMDATGSVKELKVRLGAYILQRSTPKAA